MNNSKPSVQVLANVATDQNELFHSGYVHGVAEFLRECATPMTIAIQGETGAGKTTLINLIEKELRADTQAIMGDESDARIYCEDIIGIAIIDVLLRSTAEPDTDLFMFVLSNIIPKLTGSDLAAMVQVSEFASAASHLLDAVETAQEPSEDGSAISALFSSLWGYDDNSKAQESATKEEMLKAISALKSGLTTALEQSAQSNGKAPDSRFIVFVDGLDHIEPGAAISLMEQIKTFTDCPHLVFVYTADEKTMMDGISRKYGERLADERKKMIADKLVQVPLYIPTSTYNLGKFISGLLKDEGEKEYSKDFVQVVDALLRVPTPHRLKRYLNSMYLYRNIFGGQEGVEDDQLAMLFAAVILRVESSQGFALVARCAQDDEELFDENLRAALEKADIRDGIRLANLPTLWSTGDGVDSAKRDAFLSWIRRMS